MIGCYAFLVLGVGAGYGVGGVEAEKDHEN